jgi:hypothetical protein
MEDDFMYKFRKEPRPEFKRRLFQRIDKPMNKKSVTQRVFGSWKTVIASAVAVIVVALIVSPTAQAVAQDFLNLFRVKRFAAISVDPARLKELQSSNIDVQSLISSTTEIVKNPGKPQLVDSPATAAKVAGITVRVPSQVPAGFSLSQVMVQGAGTVRFKADTSKLQTIVDAMGLTDVKVPAQLDGQTITVDKPAMVVMDYQNVKDRVTFVQSHSPQIALPDGVDMAQLGEIALRIAGMSADDAHNFAKSIDWTSTLIVPVPANAASFTTVDVRGAKGLLITTNAVPVQPVPASVKEPTRMMRPSSTLMWAEGDMVYAITGTGTVALVDIANSLQ